MKFKEKYKLIYCENDYYEEFDNNDFYYDASIEYYKGYLIHRKNKPAMKLSDGTELWYKDGKKHREDGPAIECEDRYKAWFLNGQKCTEKVINLIKNAKVLLDEI
jgi:hypothetical protein